MALRHCILISWSGLSSGGPATTSITVHRRFDCIALYCLPAAVAHLLPSVQQPVSLLPQPGALGPSAAAARAAQVLQGQDGQDTLQQGSTAAAAADAAELQAISMAAAVLEELLTDAWADEEVISAFNGHNEHSAQSQSLLQSSAQPSSSQAQQRENGSSTQDDGAEQAVNAVLNQKDFQAFAEYVLDNAMLGTLQEGGVAGTEDAAEDES